MRHGRRAGRPPAASREILEEAACELFLEKGYEATSVADITQRAGVSRATFFNYIPTKSDLLWASVDDAIDALATALEGADGGPQPAGDGSPAASAPAVAEVRAALEDIAAELEPGTIVLALANAEPMGVTEELADSAARRQHRAGRIIAVHLQRRGIAELPADVLGAAHAGAFLAAVAAWARTAVGRTPFAEVMTDALDVLAGP